MIVEQCQNCKALNEPPRRCLRCYAECCPLCMGDHQRLMSCVFAGEKIAIARLELGSAIADYNESKMR